MYLLILLLDGIFWSAEPPPASVAAPPPPAVAGAPSAWLCSEESRRESIHWHACPQWVHLFPRQFSLEMYLRCCEAVRTGCCCACCCCRRRCCCCCQEEATRMARVNEYVRVNQPVNDCRRDLTFAKITTASNENSRVSTRTPTSSTCVAASRVLPRRA